MDIGTWFFNYQFNITVASTATQINIYVCEDIGPTGGVLTPIYHTSLQPLPAVAGTYTFSGTFISNPVTGNVNYKLIVGVIGTGTHTLPGYNASTNPSRLEAYRLA